MDTDYNVILSSARNFKRLGDFTHAVENYFLYFENVPETIWDECTVKEFIDLVSDMDIFLRVDSVKTEIWRILEKSFKLFPSNWRMANALANVFMKEIEHELFPILTFQAFRLAKDKNQSCLTVEDKLLTVMWDKVPRWHFRMLNGKLRNTAYKKVIYKSLEDGYKNAIDIGAGCGLLSLYLGTHNSNPKITLFEANKTLYDQAILNMIKYCPNVSLTSIQINSNDIAFTEYRSNLLVTEIFDVAVFGEGILRTLCHALDTFMIKSNYRIIPAKVKIFVTGIGCDKLSKQFRLQNDMDILHMDETFYVTKDFISEPYDAKCILKENYEILTDTVEVMELNFHDKDFLHLILNNLWKTKIHLTGLKCALIDCLVVWFDLHLDEETIVSTNPFHSQNEPCWEQAIFHSTIPLRIDKNVLLPLEVKIVNEHLDFGLNVIPNFNAHFILDEYSILILNDEKWTSYVESLSEKIPSKRSTIFDFSSFPLMGLLLAKKGHTVFHVFRYEENLKFIEYLIKTKDIEPTLFKFVQHKDYPFCVLGQSEIDYVFYEPCCTNGSLNPSPLDNIILEKFKAKSFFTGIIVHFKLIHSPYIDYCNRVSAENVEPFEDLASKMNDFTGTEHVDLSHSFPHESMTNEQKWDMTQDSTKIVPIQILKDGKINGILTWYTLVGIGGVQFTTNESSCFKLKAFLLPERNVESNEFLNIYCQSEKGVFLKIEICEEKWLKTNFQSYDKYQLL